MTESWTFIVALLKSQKTLLAVESFSFSSPCRFAFTLSTNFITPQVNIKKQAFHFYSC